MDFSAIFQLRTKKFWWMDVIFYFVMSLLVATVLIYIIFLTKDSWQRNDIRTETQALSTVGTDQQKQYEAQVITYQKKINDFTGLLKNHEFASNVFAFMQAQTLPNIWFKQFTLDEKNDAVQLSGEADSMDAFSRQIANFESSDNQKYIKSIGILSSSLGQSERIEFNIALSLNQDIFSYLSVVPQPSQAAAVPTQPGQASPATPVTPATPTTPAAPQANAGQTPVAAPSAPQFRSSEKLITSFHILLNPEVVGVVDEKNFTVNLTVPYGTDVGNLTSAVVISQGATVSPASGISQNFSGPVIYTVTAQDGSIQNYTVTVNVAPQAATSSTSAKSGAGAIIVIALIVVIIIIIAVIFIFVWRKMRGQKANINP